MFVFVTLLALQGCRGEVRFAQLGLEVRGLVAVHASRGAVRSHQRERGFVVIESGEVLPGLGRVAGLASERFTVLARLAHSLFELAFVGIFVATGAGQVLPVKLLAGFGLGSV